jgi:polar amino acid transport system substrate-binding protein
MLSLLCSDALCAALQEPWFFLLDLLGTIAFAISGFIVASRERMSLFGTFVLCTLPAAGGGIVRDVMIQRHPIGFLSSPVYLTAIVLVVLVGSVMVRFFAAYQKQYPGRFRHFYKHSATQSKIALEVFDALGLGAFSIIAIKVVVVAKISPVWMWGPFFAMLTSCGGGILRDLFCSRGDQSLLTTVCYGEIACLWSTFFIFFLTLQDMRDRPSEIMVGVGVTVLGIFLSRIFAYFYSFPAMSLYKKFSKGPAS